VDRAAHLVAEDGVHKLMLLDATKPVKAVGDHFGPKVIAGPGRILDRRASAWKRGFDSRSQVIRARHRIDDSDEPGVESNSKW
jgi:hypothetical protein